MHQQPQFFSLQTQFENLLPNITLVNTLSYSNRQDKAILRDPQPSEVLATPKTISRIPQKSTLMTWEETPKYLLLATCFIEKSAMSTVTIHMISKNNPERTATKKLKSLYLRITTLKFYWDRAEELVLLVGTSCGRLLFYRGFESGKVEVECLHFCYHRVVNLIVPSFRCSVFVLTSNATIYLIDTCLKQISYQFQCELPNLQDPTFFLFMDSSQNYICCAFSYGRIIVWEITDKMKTHFQTGQSLVQKQRNEQGTKQRKEGKKKGSRNVVLRPKTNLNCCIKEGIKWIDFVGSFIGVVTQDCLFRIIAVDLCSQLQNTELFLTVSSFPLIDVPSLCEEDRKVSLSLIQRTHNNLITLLHPSEHCSRHSRIAVYHISENCQLTKKLVMFVEEEILQLHYCRSSALYIGRTKDSLLFIQAETIENDCDQIC